MTVLKSPTLKIALKLHPVLKTVIYAGMAAELVKNTGMKDDRQIDAIQKVVADGLVSKVIIRARASDGREETYTMWFPPFNPGDTVKLALEDGKGFCEMMDTGLAAAVQYAANQIKRLNLTPRYEVEWSDKAKASPHLVANAARTLNLTAPATPEPPPVVPQPQYDWDAIFAAKERFEKLYNDGERFSQTVHTRTAPPPVPTGFQRTTVLEISPAKDPGMGFRIESLRRIGG